MSRRTQGLTLIGIGILVLVVSLGADALGIGGYPGIGWKQGLGAAAGAIILAVGAWYWPGVPGPRGSAEAAAIVSAKESRHLGKHKRPRRSPRASSPRKAAVRRR